MRRHLIVLLMTVAVSLVGAQAAFAAVASHITAAYNTSTEKFHGTVTSSNAECEAHRTVKVFKKTSSGRVLEGKTTSGSKGSWHLEVMNAKGKYVAVTPKQKEMGIACGQATSSVVDVM